MGGEQVDFEKWKQMAQGVLGEDFFDSFFTDAGEAIGGRRSQGIRYNVYRNNSELVVLVELPYIQDISQVRLTVFEQELQVQGEIRFGFDHYETIHAGIFSGSFDTKISLPYPVNTKRVNAHYRRGILKVQLFPSHRGGDQTVPILGE